MKNKQIGVLLFYDPLIEKSGAILMGLGEAFGSL